MTQVTISEAARRVGVARSTLLRHIKNGKVSKVIGKDGKPRLDTSELSALTQEMLSQGFSEGEIRAVMGENTIRFLTQNLPDL